MSHIQFWEELHVLFRSKTLQVLKSWELSFGIFPPPCMETEHNKSQPTAQQTSNKLYPTNLQQQSVSQTLTASAAQQKSSIVTKRCFLVELLQYGITDTPLVDYHY